MLDLDAPNVTAKIRRIVCCLDTAPHLFDDRRHWCIHRHEECIASELGPNPTTLEDRCMFLLRLQKTKAAKLRLLATWTDDLLINDDQQLFLCRLHKIDPKDIR